MIAYFTGDDLTCFMDVKPSEGKLHPVSYKRCMILKQPDYKYWADRYNEKVDNPYGNWYFEEEDSPEYGTGRIYESLTFCKDMCDRIANMEHSKEYNNSRYQMYLKEYPEFKMNLKSPDHPREVEFAWMELEKLNRVRERA